MRHSVTSILKKASMASCVAMLTSLCYAQGGTLESWGSLRIPPLAASGYSAVTSSGSHSVALRTDGSVICWGQNTSGECVVPEPNSNFTAVAASDSISAGLKSDGSVVCWGRNENHECDVPEPNKDFISIAAGINFFLGLKKDGTVVSWGQSFPWPSNEDNHNIRSIYAQDSIAVAIRTDGSAVVWGQVYLGQGMIPQPNSGFTLVRGDRYHCAGLKTDGSIVCWGDNKYGQCDVPNPNSDFCSVLVGSTFTVGVKTNGTLVAWGKYNGSDVHMPIIHNDYKSLNCNSDKLDIVDKNGVLAIWKFRDGGYYNTENSSISNSVSGCWDITEFALSQNGRLLEWIGGAAHDATPPSSIFTKVKSYRYYTLALSQNGVIYAYSNTHAEPFDLGEGNSDIIDMAALESGIIGLKSDGSFVQWKNIGDLRPEVNQGFVSVDGFGLHFVGLRSDSSVACWGNNMHGQLNIPSPNADYVDVKAGGEHTIGLKRDGSIVCWGSNADGQCDVPSPNTDFIAISAGMYHSVGLKRNGSIVCWGNNTYGQCSIPEPNEGFTAIGSNEYSTIGVRNTRSITGKIELSDFIGDSTSHTSTISIAKSSTPAIKQYSSLIPNADGSFSVLTSLLPPYDVRISSDHFLSTKLTGVDPSQSLNAALVNGDADGDGHINLFDYVKLDASFNSSDPMADLDGDGQVNLFDYVIIDRSFGAQAQ